MSNSTLQISSKPLIVYIITALMLFTSAIYFIVTLEDYEELLQLSQSSNADINDIISIKNEINFFLIVAIAYIPIALWILKVKHNSKLPYIISITGSLALILFYILTRTVDISPIGLQTDVGMIDILSKIFQGSIVALSSYLVVSVLKNGRKNFTEVDRI